MSTCIFILIRCGSRLSDTDDLEKRPRLSIWLFFFKQFLILFLHLFRILFLFLIAYFVPGIVQHVIDIICFFYIKHAVGFICEFTKDTLINISES